MRFPDIELHLARRRVHEGELQLKRQRQITTELEGTGKTHDLAVILLAECEQMVAGRRADLERLETAAA